MFKRMQHRPDYEKLVPGEGLPIEDNPEQRGDLVINFDVEFPVYLPIASKNYIKKAFKTPKMIAEGIADTNYTNRLTLNDKMRQNVDADIPIRRDRNDELEKLKESCKI